MKAAKKPHPTLGLAMIMKDEVEDLERIINDYGKYFDKIYVTVTDKKTHTTLLKKIAKNPTAYKLVELSYFKWIDHFGKARLYNQKQIRTDYWMWMDLDDEIEGAEKLQRVLEYMVTNDLDAVWLEYNYSRRLSFSDPEAISRRERIIKTASKLTWKDEAVHETINIQAKTKQEFLSQVMIKHRKTAEQSLASGERNRPILEKDWQRSHRPVTAYYLGAHLGGLGDYEGAIEKLSFAAEHSEDNVFKFAAWLNLCISYFQTGKYNESIAAANECIAIDPNHPEPWYHKFTAYRALGAHDSAMESAEISMSKPMPEGLTTQLNQDISWYQYKGPLNIAHAYLTIGNIERAYQLYKKVKRTAPEYIEEVSATTGIQLGAVFEQAYKEFKNNSR